MKNRIYFMAVKVFLPALVVLAGCKTGKEIQSRSKSMVTDSGLKLEWLSFGSGKQVAKGDVVTVHYTGRLETDSVFDSSIKRGQPIQVTAGAGQVIKGWDEALPLLFEGDEVLVTIPPDLAYGNRSVGMIPANSTLKFEMEVLKTVTPRKPDPWILESADTIRLESGLKYIMLEKGNGATVAYGRQVTVHYTGYLTDGTIFDSSVKRGRPITFEVGTGKVIKGWDEALLKLRKNDRARLIIPPSLGYGDRQMGPIPANSTLIFDIEVVNVTE